MLSLHRQYLLFNTFLHVTPHMSWFPLLVLAHLFSYLFWSRLPFWRILLVPCRVTSPHGPLPVHWIEITLHPHSLMSIPSFCFCVSCRLPISPHVLSRSPTVFVKLFWNYCEYTNITMSLCIYWSLKWFLLCCHSTIVARLFSQKFASILSCSLHSTKSFARRFVVFPSVLSRFPTASIGLPNSLVLLCVFCITLLS